MIPDNLEADALVELMDMTAEQLERRAEKLLRMSRDLTAQALRLARVAALPAERSIGRGGVVVSEVEAIAAAKDLKEFTRTSFAEALGLTPSGVSRWLAKLLDRENPIIERREDGGYAYIDPAPVSELRAERPQRSRRAHRGHAAGGAGGVQGTGHSQLLRGVHKDLQPIVRRAIDDGWSLSRDGGGTGHFKLSRTGQAVSFPTTPRNAGDAVTILRQRLARADRES